MLRVQYRQSWTKYLHRVDGLGVRVVGMQSIGMYRTRTDKLLSLDRRILLSSFTPLPMTNY